MPSRTPKKMTPAGRHQRQHEGGLADVPEATECCEVGQRERGRDDDGGQRRLREVGEQGREGDRAAAPRSRRRPGRSPGSWRPIARPRRCVNRSSRRRSPGRSRRPGSRRRCRPSPGWDRPRRPRRAAKLDEVAMVSVSDTRVMPTAAKSSGARSERSVQGSAGRGRPSGRAPTVGMSRPNNAVTTVAPITATRTAGILVRTVGQERGARRGCRGRRPARSSSADRSRSRTPAARR